MVHGQYREYKSVVFSLPIAIGRSMANTGNTIIDQAKTLPLAVLALSSIGEPATRNS